jgi:XTP/dITP diphosphohydrolase
LADRVVLASNNAGKLAELGGILAKYSLTLLPLSRFASESPDETGTTFHENALLKARFAARTAHLPAIADDSGLEVDSLQGAPGVYSARYAGLDADDRANNAKLLFSLRGVPESLRTARFRCVLAYVQDEIAEPVFAEGVWEGRILTAPRGSSGFGYDPLFLPLNNSLTAAEMTSEDKNRLSHRAQALRNLVASLPWNRRL